MALNPSPQGNYDTPIPNSPFYWPETYTIQAGNGILVVGTGLTVNAFGQLTATGGGGGGTGTVTQVNTGAGLQGGPITASGTISLVPPTGSSIGGVKAGSGISIDVNGTISSTRVSQVSTGVGLTGGPITSSGTIALAPATITTIGGVKPDNTTIIVQPDGTLSVGPSIADSVNSVQAAAPVTIDNTDPANPIIGVRNASIAQSGVVSLSNSITGTSQSIAATELAVSNLSSASLLKTGGTMTGNIGFAATQTFPVATSTSLGVVQPDNTTIVINGAGQLSAVNGGGGSGGTVTLVNTGTGLTGGPITVNGTISLLPSTTSVIGGVRPDGVTTSVDANGVISVIPGSAGGVQSISGTAPITVNNTVPSAPVISVNQATTTLPGVVSVGSNIGVSNGVISVPNATATQAGVVTVNDLADTSQTVAASTYALSLVNNVANAALPKAGGTMTGNLNFATLGAGLQFGDGSGINTVSSSTSSTSTTTAANSAAVKSAYDLADSASGIATAALPKAGGVMTGNITFAGTQTIPAPGSTNQLLMNQGGVLGVVPGVIYDPVNGALALNEITGAGVTSGLLISGTDSTTAKGGDVIVIGGSSNTDTPGNILIQGAQGNTNNPGGNVSIRGGISGGSSLGSGNVEISDISVAEAKPGYFPQNSTSLVTKDYVDSVSPITPGGTLFLSSPSVNLTTTQAQFWCINSWSNSVIPGTLDNIAYNPTTGTFTNNTSQRRTYAFTAQAAFTASSAITDAALLFLKNSTVYASANVYGQSTYGRGTGSSQGLITTTWTFDLNPGEYVAVGFGIVAPNVVFSNSTIGGLSNGSASTLIVTEIPGLNGAGNTGGSLDVYLPETTFNSGTNYLLNWPAASGISTLSYNNGVFTNNTNQTRVYTLDYQSWIATDTTGGGSVQEADIWVIYNNGSAPDSTTQRRGQAATIRTAQGYAGAFTTGSATVTVQPGGTFGVAFWALTSTGNPYVIGGASGAALPAGRSTRLSISEVTNLQPQYQGGVFQNTQTPTAYTAGTNTLLTFPTEIANTCEPIRPEIVNGVRVWENSSTYPRTYIVNYTAVHTATSNIGLAAIWFQKNTTTATASGRFGMQSQSGIQSTQALISSNAVITLDPGEFITAWFYSDTSGTIGGNGFGSISGQSTRFTLTEVTAVQEGFNQFPSQYGVTYSSNNTSQTVPGSTFVQVPANNIVFENSINPNLIPITNNKDGSWTCNQSGLYSFTAEITMNAFTSSTVVTAFFQVGTSRFNSSIYVPAGYAPYYVTVSGTSFVQAGNEISLNFFNQANTTITNATMSITTIQG